MLYPHEQLCEAVMIIAQQKTCSVDKNRDLTTLRSLPLVEQKFHEGGSRGKAMWLPQRCSSSVHWPF